MRLFRFLLLAFLILFAAPLLSHAAFWRLHGWADNWNRADWTSAGVLPPAADVPETQIHFLAARVGRWRGIFAEHCWVVMKSEGGPWRRFDVVGWGMPVRENSRAPDGRWYGNTPRIFASYSGAYAERLMPEIERAIASYPFQAAGSYSVWPGPNSNTFIRHIAMQVPDLRLALPNTAIGRGFRTDGRFIGLTPSGTGVELTLGGWFGVSLGWVEGLEIDVLSAVFGIDVLRPAIKLPGWGRVGLDGP